MHRRRLGRARHDWEIAMSNARILEIRAAEAAQAELVRRLAAEELRRSCARPSLVARWVGLPTVLLVSALLVPAIGA